MANLPIRTINGKEIEAVYATSSFSATSASYAFSATSASFVTTAQTASFVTASNVYGPFGSNSVISSSRAVTSSFATTASFVTTAQTASFVTTAQTASFVTASNVYGPYGSNSVLSSSYAITASYAADSANFANTDLTFTGQRIHNTNTNGLAIVTQPGGTEGSSFNLNDNFLEIRSNSGSSGTNRSILGLSKDSYAYFQNQYQGISLLGVSTNSGYITGSDLSSTASMYIWSPRIRISGSIFVTGSITGTNGVINQLTASHAITASFITASNVYGPYGSNSIITSSYAVTSSFTTTASYVVGLQGTGQYIPVWSGSSPTISSILRDSALFQDTSNNIAIGSTGTFGAKFNVVQGSNSDGITVQTSAGIGTTLNIINSGTGKLLTLTATSVLLEVSSSGETKLSGSFSVSSGPTVLTGSLITSGSRVRNYRTITISTYSLTPTEAILPTDDIILVIDNTTGAPATAEGNLSITSFLSTSPAGRCVEIVKVKDGTGSGLILKNVGMGIGLMINNTSNSNGTYNACDTLGSSITLMSMGLSSTGSAWGTGV